MPLKERNNGLALFFLIEGVTQPLLSLTLFSAVILIPVVLKSR